MKFKLRPQVIKSRREGLCVCYRRTRLTILKDYFVDFNELSESKLDKTDNGALICLFAVKPPITAHTASASLAPSVICVVNAYIYYDPANEVNFI